MDVRKQHFGFPLSGFSFLLSTVCLDPTSVICRTVVFNFVLHNLRKALDSQYEKKQM